MKIIFVTGLQKSGTSLLNRLLMQQPAVSNPFLPEGKFFWGDDPPFTPEAEPCGHIYQHHQGHQGHQITAPEATAEHRLLLQQRIEKANISTPVLMNKNPYNVVRLPWVKAMFPDAKVVVIFRKPAANVFSLLKKYELMSQDQSGDGWWGVKPAKWEKLLQQDKLGQAVDQWLAVNRCLLDHADCIDYLLEYADLCADPKRHLDAMAALVGENGFTVPDEPLRCMDEEHLTGGLLDSRNKEMRQTGGFALKATEVVEFPGLYSDQIRHITEQTEGLYQALRNRVD